MFRFFISAILLVGLSHAAVDPEKSCSSHIESTCYEPGNEWAGSSLCSAVHGGFRGNAQNLHVIMNNHFRDSFKLLSLSSKFNTDQVNFMGFHNYFKSYSDQLWDNGLKILNYINERGGRVGAQSAGFTYNDVGITEVHGPLDALAMTLDILKQHVNAVSTISGFAQRRRHTSDDADAPDTFDPAISHFLEESFLESYTSTIRKLSGQVNTLGKLLKEDRSSSLAIIMFDKALKG